MLLVGDNPMRLSVWRLVLQVAHFGVVTLACKEAPGYIAAVVDAPVVVLFLDPDSGVMRACAEAAPGDYAAVTISRDGSQAAAAGQFAVVVIDGLHVTARVLNKLRLATTRKRGPKCASGIRAQRREACVDRHYPQTPETDAAKEQAA